MTNFMGEEADGRNRARIRSRIIGRRKRLEAKTIQLELF